MSWSVLIADSLAREGLEILREEAQVVEDDRLEALGSVDALIVRSRTKVTAKVISDGSPKLKVVGRAGVGVDNIDLEAARAAPITVVNTPEAATVAVAEHTFGLLLAMARRIPFADSSMRKGEWQKKALKGIELFDKTLGLIGVGRVGSAMARRAAAFGMHLIGYDALLPSETIRARGVEPVTLGGVLSRADFISLHVPLNEQTRHLIDASALAMVKPGACLINTARGGLIDEDALLLALEEGRLAGVALDVHAQEPPGKQPLLEHPHVVSTPHIAAQTFEAQRRASIDIAHEVLSALRGETLRWRVV